MSDPYKPPFNRELHLKYWRRCFRSLLPHHYLSMESNRMALAFFMVGAADVFPAPSPAAASSAEPTPPPPEALVPDEQKPILREWILAQQHASGGFCGSPSVSLPRSVGEVWDFTQDAPGQERSGLANMAATVFALQLLAVLAEDGSAESAFSGVDRVKTLRWLRRLQRDDGSFGEEVVELPGRGWFIGGGYDMRHCYLATIVRWILRGDLKQGDPGWVEDFDTAKLIKYISSTQTYDGGLAGTSKDEPHAGYAYCAVAALSLLDRPLEGDGPAHRSQAVRAGIPNTAALVHWLASRQFVYLEASEDEQDDDDNNHVQPAGPVGIDSDSTLVGFNGRCNKVADTCYTWWAAATLANLGHHDLIQVAPARRFLLEKTQHAIGGFGKKPGSPPDIYHSFFGLAALAVMREPGLKEFDTTLAVTKQVVRRMEKARRGLLGQPVKETGDTRQRLADLDAKLNDGEKLSWLDAVGA